MPGTKPSAAQTSIRVQVQKTNAHFRKMRVPGGEDFGTGTFLLLLDITAFAHDVFVPLSVASGKKPTGFIYEIEGTKQGEIATTHITCEGHDASQITLGTILYCKIPATKTVPFRIIIETRGKLGGEYKVVLNQIHYKLDPSDARYLKHTEDFPSESVRFS